MIGEPSPPTVPVIHACLTSEPLAMKEFQTLDTTLDNVRHTLDTQNLTKAQTLVSQGIQTLDTHSRQEGERGGSYQVSNVDFIPKIENLTTEKKQGRIYYLFDKRRLS